MNEKISTNIKITEQLRDHFDIINMASEGGFTLPLEDGSPAGVLAPQNNYCEFIPETQIEHAHPDILTPTELEAEKCYKIIITNENGLYRYDINDNYLAFLRRIYHEEIELRGKLVAQYDSYCRKVKRFIPWIW